MINATAIILYGSLMLNSSIREEAQRAFADLERLGYKVPTADSPVKFFPVQTEKILSNVHAGGWRPGIIYLREEPKSSFGLRSYIRHELMHEASFRTCKGRLKRWEEEAHAIIFSGESSPEPQSSAPKSLDGLAEKLKYDRELSVADYSELRAILAKENPRLTPCQNVNLSAINVKTDYTKEALLMHLHSGRIYDAEGDIERKEPPGSLLKIVLAASIAGDVSAKTDLESGLLASDSKKMSKFCKKVEPSIWRMLTGNKMPECSAMLGLMDSQSRFPIQQSLVELALMLRASILSRFDTLKVLQQNGENESSTLFKSGSQLRELLSKHRVIGKTGTVSNAIGLPLVGYAAYVWPAENPTFLSIVRQRGLVGHSTARANLQKLAKWTNFFDPKNVTASIRIMSRLQRSMWSLESPCGLVRTAGLKEDFLFSPCGFMKLTSTAMKAKAERFIHGLIGANVHGPSHYSTDIITYTEGVLDAELSGVKGPAADALEAVIAYNATRALARHEGPASLCDTTHCMVYRGDTSQNLKPVSFERYGRMHSLLQLLEVRAKTSHLSWLPFSLGGDDPWSIKISMDTLAGAFNVEILDDLRRVRDREGRVLISYKYPGGEGDWTCEVFRNKLKLLSCPDEIRLLPDGGYMFYGRGEGHGLGLDIKKAISSANAGRSADGIIHDAY